MINALQKLLGLAGGEPLHLLPLKASCAGEAGQMLVLLPRALSACGGWLLRCAPPAHGSARVVFEFERSALMEVYVVLAELGLLLDKRSEMSLTQAWQCTRFAPRHERFEVVTIELEITQRTGSDSGCMTAA